MSSEEIAEAVKIPPNYLRTAIRRLKEAGYIETERGQNGGYRIVEPADSISLYDALRLMEPEKINRCLEEGHFCSRAAYGVCAVSHFYQLAQEEWDRMLKKITLQVLASDPREETLREILRR